MTCKDFKNLSLNQLRGKWGKAIIALFVATLVVMAVSFIVNFPAQLTANLINTGSSVSAGMFIFISSYSLIGTIVLLFVSGCMTYGMNKYLLNLVRTGNSEFSYIFTGFSYGFNTIMRSFLLMLLIGIFTFLWSLLLVIPGIIASYRYSQAFYLLADNDDMTALEALRASKEMMKGYKWKLFVLSLSFIGWILLGAITLGIGFIFLSPYINTAFTNFYEYLRGIRDNSQNAQTV